MRLLPEAVLDGGGPAAPSAPSPGGLPGLAGGLAGARPPTAMAPAWREPRIAPDDEAG